jgi:hypothetical protein
MIFYVLFVHRKSVSKRKVCIIFIKIKKNLKKQKKNIFSRFFRWVFLGGFFLGGFFNCQPWKEEEEEEDEDDGDLSKYDLWGNEEEGGGGEDKNGKGEGKEGKEVKKKKSRSRSSSR